MQLSMTTRLTLLSAVAAAVLAACGGGGNSPAPTAQTPQSAGLSPQSADALATPDALTVPGAAASALTDVRNLPADSDGMASRAQRAAATRAAHAKTYIVQLADPPAASYDGRIAGFAATRPGQGQKIDRKSPAVSAYLSHLAANHDRVLRDAGGGRKLYSYGLLFNGFAAELSDAQVQKLKGTKGVLAVNKDEMRKLDTASTPTFLGLAGNKGLWTSTGAKGENIVIGMVDSGITPESGSFSDALNGRRDYRVMPQGWHGACVTGPGFSTDNCNYKLIGARFYNEGWGGNEGVAETFPYEFLSPRDWGGHGTHTSSTAGGNAGVPITGPASALGTISGMAPRARIATYKVCWSVTELGGGCFNSDSVAAIEDAVADGVDVINFSIGGYADTFVDPVSIAFLEAAQAGVFVAAAAGNDGPDTSTVEHPAPWITTVAAGTHNRNGAGNVALGNHVTYSGASFSPDVASGPFVEAVAAAYDGADLTKARLCYAADDNAGVAVLDPAKTSGKIVLCDRGVTARVNKSLAVAQAGGVGMVMVNPTANSLNADIHSVPSVHVADTVYTAIHGYAATVGATATVSKGSIVLNIPAPFTASFSSRGPSLAAGGNILKPDIMAPGQDIIAAFAPPGNGGKNFDIISGTSMATPHIAGIAALFKQLHPEWSPMAIKSALMTSATDILDGPSTNPLVIFRQGAGHVNPNGAIDPGLVFDSNYNDWLGFLCTNGVDPAYCASQKVTPITASAMNTASIAVADLAGFQTVTRRVTNTSRRAATYTPSVAGMPGITTTVSPSRLQLAPGQTKSFTVTFRRTSAALNTYVGGQLTWTDGRHNVRIPMVVQPVALAAPAETTGSYNVKFGYDGAFSATPRGLVPATVNTGTVSQDQDVYFTFVVPAGTTYARFALMAADYPAGTDLDLFIYYNDALVGQSSGSTADEQVSFTNPPAGTYTVKINGFAVPGHTLPYKHYAWALGSTSAGNMTVSAPSAATTGGTGTIGISATGLSTGKYLGSIVYGGADGLPDPTIVRIDH